MLVLILLKNFSHANFTYKKDVPFARGKINYKHPDFSLVGLYVEDENGEYIETVNVPIGDYEVNTSKTYCTKPNGDEKVNDSNVVISYVNNSLTFGGVTTKNTKCYVYLDLKPVITQNTSSVLAKYTKSTSRSGQITAPFTGSTPTTVYSKTDDGGTSYVFAGVNPNNWVKIGNIYFRIIRFNGNGGLRLIYSGEDNPSISGDGVSIGTHVFNSTYNNNAYVGLQYATGKIHGLTNNSSVLGTSTSTDITTLYGWYNSKIKPKYASIIDVNAGFCSDRSPSTDQSTSNGNGGTGTTSTWYGANLRYIKASQYPTSFNPVLKCNVTSDLLKLPVGLITADEYALAGGGTFSATNTKFWLYTGVAFWTMTPSSYLSEAHVFFGITEGCIEESVTSAAYQIRPVINLKSSTLFLDGDYDGTAEKPWTVKI